MFKCCVCHGKSSRKTSQEEDDSSREVDDDEDDSSTTSSSSETSEDEEEAENEKEVVEHLKGHNQNISFVAEKYSMVEETNKEKFPNSTKIVVEVNGESKELKNNDTEKTFVRDAVKEDIVDILSCAVKIVTEIRKSETEKLEKIKEELFESSNEDITDRVANSGIKYEKEESFNEINKMNNNGKKGDSEEMQHDVSEDEGEYEIIEEIKKSDGSFTKSKIEEKIMEEFVKDLNEEADNAQELKEIIHSDGQVPNNEQIESTQIINESNGVISETPPPPFCEVEIIEEIKKADIYKIESRIRESICTMEVGKCELSIKESGFEEDQQLGCKMSSSPNINGDLLSIPPPTTPPPEDTEDSVKLDDSSNTEMSFPTPPPIDFDIAESSQEEEGEELNFNLATSDAPLPIPPWEDESNSGEQTKLENFLHIHGNQDWKIPSPGSKSLPSPPSPGSETGCETEAESKSSGDEQTSKVRPCRSSKKAYIERTLNDAADDDGDDSVFEATSLVKDSETLKDIPPRPGMLFKLYFDIAIILRNLTI